MDTSRFQSDNTHMKTQKPWTPLGLHAYPNNTISGTHWGPTKGPLGSTAATPGSHWGPTGLPLGSHWVPLGPTGVPLGSHWGPTGVRCGHTGVPLGSHWGPTGSHWGPTGVPLGSAAATPGSHWGPTGVPLGSHWGPLCPVPVPRACDWLPDRTCLAPSQPRGAW